MLFSSDKILLPPQQPTIVPIVSNISIIHIVMITIITVNTEPAGNPPLKTSVKDKNTLFSPPKKFAKFSQNFQETPPLPERTDKSVTPRGIPTIAAPKIPKMIEPFYFLSYNNYNQAVRLPKLSTLHSALSTKNA